MPYYIKVVIFIKILLNKYLIQFTQLSIVTDFCLHYILLVKFAELMLDFLRLNKEYFTFKIMTAKIRNIWQL